jgi:YidC/Oxa1 family membrane protein insertase
MNKQTITGHDDIGLILFGFSWYQNRQQKKFIEEKRVQDSIARANAPKPAEAQFDSVAAAQALQAAQPTPQADPLGAEMAAARSAETQCYKVSNDVMNIEFSSLGGAVSDVVLRDYLKYGGEPLHLWKPGSEAFDVSFFVKKGFHDAQINTREFNFTCEVSGGTEWSEGETSKTVSMRLPVDSLAYVEFLYTIPRDDYMIGYQVNFVGMRDMMSTQTNFGIEWVNTSLQNEKGFDNENNYTTIAYRYPATKKIEQVGMARAGQTKQESVSSKVSWVAFKQQFFSSVLIAEDDFQEAELQYYTYQPGDGTVKKFQAQLTVPMERDKTSYDFKLYFGPNKFSQLKTYDISLERLVPLGGSIIGWISRLVVIPLFDWLGTKGLSFGWIIFLMTLFIKIVIFPLTFTSYKSSAKMRVIKPEVDEINARFPAKEDAMQKQQATMELYKRAGINPMAGCIPMLIQFPIIIAMFRFFPASIELRQEPLWWADDLSSYDSILNLGFNIPFYGDHISLFALLMAVSMFGYSWLNYKQMGSSQPQMAGMKFMMLYLMPVMLLFWFNNYAAGLCFYYLLSNLFTIVQMYGVRFAINEDKLRKKMLETPAKAKKKSGFMARLEAAQKAQQEAVRKQQQSTGGLPPTKNRRPAQQPKKKR